MTILTTIGQTIAGTGGGMFSKLAMIGSAAGTGISAFSQMKAASGIEAAGRAQQEAANIRAQQIADEGRERTARIREQNRHTIAATRAQMAAGGTMMGAGSSLTFLGEQARRLEMKAADEARKTFIGSANERYSGKMARWNAKQKASATRLRGFGTLLEGVSSHARLGKDLGAYNFGG